MAGRADSIRYTGYDCSTCVRALECRSSVGGVEASAGAAEVSDIASAMATMLRYYREPRTRNEIAIVDPDFRTAV